MSVCPFCSAQVDDEAWCEIAHMSNVHPEIVAQRLRDAGLQTEAEVIEHRTRLAELERRIDATLTQLQTDVAILSVLLPDLPERHKRLIDGVLAAIHDWESTR